MGGVSGHAGLFSNTYDIANYAQMMLNHGIYNGKRIFSNRSISKFTKRQNMPINSDFALGWDTPSKKGSTAGDFFSQHSYGHLGFTGTSLWIDSEQNTGHYCELWHNLVFLPLSCLVTKMSGFIILELK